MDTMTLIAETLAPAAGKRVLDVGCGSGFLAKALVAQGARVDGIDPATKAIETARTTEPSATFQVGPAEALPFADQTFDAVIFLNSLHHVDAAAMAPALCEAARVVKPDGLVIVVEPLASGSFFSAMLPIDDETAVRGLAQDAVRASLAAGVFERVRQVEYVRHERFADLDQFPGPDVGRRPVARRDDRRAPGRGRGGLPDPCAARAGQPSRPRPAAAGGPPASPRQGGESRRRLIA